MITRRSGVAALSVVCLCAGLWAQGAPSGASGAAGASGAKIEPVLSHLPAGSMGFVVINNAKAMADKVDKLLVDLGLEEMLKNPDKPDQKFSVLSFLKEQAKLGDGFYSDGGVAAVMLDPKAFDIDLLKLMNLTPTAMKMAAADDATERSMPAVPFVLFVPGSGVKEVFGAYEMKPAGKHTLVKLRMGAMFAAKRGGYVLLSPVEKALDAVLSAEKGAVSELPKEQADAIATADLAYAINMKVAGPVAGEVIKALEGQMGGEMGGRMGPIAPLMSFYFTFYRDLINQVESIAVALRLVDTGLVMDEMVSFKPDSTYGKAMRSQKALGKGEFSALANLKYVLAWAAAGDADPQSAQIAKDLIDSFLATDLLKGLPDEEKARLKKLVDGANTQVTGMQLVGGGAPEGSGLFGVAVVMKCNDADKVKELLADEAALVQALIKHVAKDNEDVKKLSIQYQKGIETVGSVSADAIVVHHPEMDTMKENDRAEMKKVLGEDKIRFLVAAPDKNTVVLTFGGSRAFLAEALKAASAGAGTIGTDEDAQAAMKYLPKDRSAVILFNAANLFDLIVGGVKTMSPDQELPPFKITCKTPIAAAAGVTGRSAHVVVYMPTKLAKDIAGIITTFVAPTRGAVPGAAPVKPDKDL